MASKQDIMIAAAGETAPISMGDLAKKMGLKAKDISGQLARMAEKDGELVRDQEGCFVLSEKGKQILQATVSREAWGGAAPTPPQETTPTPPPPNPEGGAAPIPPSTPPTQEDMQTTEYQQFLNYGLRIGVTPAIAGVTAEHVFRGGDYHNMDWVWEGITQQGIRPDMAQRWFHSWRSFLHQPIPQSLASVVGTPLSATGQAVEGVKPSDTGKGRRDYIIGPDNLPVQVGEGLGDMDYEDAVRLATVRSLAQAKLAAAGAGGAAGPMSLGSFGDELAKVIKAVQEISGGHAGKSYVVTSDGKGGHKVQELDSTKPVIVENPASGTPAPVGKSYMVDADGNAKELEPGKPVVIIKPASDGGGAKPAKRYLIDNDTGKVTEVGDDPVVIIRTVQSPANAPLSTPIQLTTPDGKPMVMDLNTYFAVEDHKAKVRREDERHDIVMDIGKSFKDLLTKAGRAASHAVGKEEAK